MRKQLIGVFDSGFGGLEVLREIVKKLPAYDYLYLADSKRAPYGDLTCELIYQNTKKAVDYLFNQNCQLVILACNTASSLALRRLQQQYLKNSYLSKKVLGVLIPACQSAIKQTKNKKVGVMATKATVDSRIFEREIKNLKPSINIYQQACPLLVPLVESGNHNLKETILRLTDYLKPLLKEKIDTLILGCTHYGILKDKIKQIIGPKIKIIVEGKIAAIKLKDYLRRHPEIEKKLTQNSSLRFLTTGSSRKFDHLGSLFFRQAIKSETINLD